jgi:hypothetical protein
MPNIPGLPIAIFVPVSLVDQWVSEMHKFLRYGSFDIFPYLNSHNSRPNWWTDIWKMSKQPEKRKILVASLPVCDSIYSVICVTTLDNIGYHYTLPGPEIRLRLRVRI